MDRADLTAMFLAAVAAVDPAELVEAELRRGAFERGDSPVVVLALGKAAAGMVWGAQRALGDSLTGVAILESAADLPRGVTGIVGGHPVPDERSLAAGERLLEAAAGAPAGAIVLCLLSGGGSALAEVPAAGLGIEDVAEVNRLLLGSGAPISEVNIVRRALSRIKGGQLGAAVASPRLLTLAISDVGSAGPATIASGPTLALDSAGETALEVVTRWGLAEDLSPRVTAALGEVEAPPRRSHDLTVLADGSTAATAAAAAAERLGLVAEISERELTGEAGAEARRVVADAQGRSADVVVYHGETTVTVTGSGRGGRNHEAALAAAIVMAGKDGTFLAAGTDGIDGSSGGAGAVVDGMTAARGLEMGLNPAALLADNDSAAFFDAVPGRIVTGPTGTNVADIWMVSGAGA